MGAGVVDTEWDEHTRCLKTAVDLLKPSQLKVYLWNSADYADHAIVAAYTLEQAQAILKDELPRFYTLFIDQEPIVFDSPSFIHSRIS